MNESKLTIYVPPAVVGRIDQLVQADPVARDRSAWARLHLPRLLDVAEGRDSVTGPYVKREAQIHQGLLELFPWASPSWGVLQILTEARERAALPGSQLVTQEDLGS